METDGLELNKIRNEDINTACLNMQKPKRVLHFSDGVMEEYSDDEDELDSVSKKPEEWINEKDLTWAPYMRVKANKVGSSVLSGIDYVGGGLASFLGITASEADLAAANRMNDVQQNRSEEHCDTWNHNPNDAVISTEIKRSPRANLKTQK